MMSFLQVSLAYKILALQLMVGEVNFFASQLNLPCTRPLTMTNFDEVYVSPPGLHSIGFSGSISTTNYLFGFLQGHLSTIHQRNGENWFLNQYPVWAETPSLITTNIAHLMASQWLASVSVDVSALESNNSVSISQLEVLKSVLPRSIRDRKQHGKNQKLPVFYVKWGENQFKMFGKSTSPAALVTILGTTKELYELRIADKSILHRPVLSVPHAEEIACLPDEPLRPLIPQIRQGLDITELLSVPTNYQAAARQAMLDKVNRFISELPMRGGTSIAESNILDYYVRPPRFGLGGNLLTTNYNFRFNEHGKLYEIHQQFPPAEGRDDFTLVLGTNEVHQLATQWLASVDVDVEKLESTRKGFFHQRGVYNEQPYKRAWFFAVWMNNGRTDIEIIVDGSSGVLCGMEFNDDSWLERPSMVPPTNTLDELHPRSRIESP